MTDTMTTIDIAEEHAYQAWLSGKITDAEFRQARRDRKARVHKLRQCLLAKVGDHEHECQ